MVILYLLYLSPAIFRYGQEVLLTWQMIASIYGNIHAIVLVMTKMDPVLFVLYWISLFLAQLWIEQAKVSTSTKAVPSKV